MNVHAFSHVQDLGWSAGNVICEDVGFTGLGKYIEVVKKVLIGKNAGQYDIWYSLHIQDRGFLNWSKNGEVSGTVCGNVQVCQGVARKLVLLYMVCCAQNSGLDVIKTAYCPYMVDWAKENGRRSAMPQSEYFVLYDWDGNSVPNHIGIVKEIDSQWEIDAIEGNTGNPVGCYEVYQDYGTLGYVNPF